MASVLSEFMIAYACGSVKRKATSDYSTRRNRRAIVKRILLDLCRLREAEEHLLNNAPENLQDAPIYTTAEEYIAVYDDVIDLLEGMVP